MRKTLLKPEKDGYYRRNIGYLPKAWGGYRQPKISLGSVKKTAQDRLNRITAIWKRIELAAAEEDEKPIWSELAFSIVKSIAKGQTEYRFELPISDPCRYAQIIEGVAKVYPEIAVLPEDEDLYRKGKELENLKRSENEEVEKVYLEFADTIQNIILQSPEDEQKYSDLLGNQTFHKALDDYSEHISIEKFDKSEKAINDTGVNKLKLLKMIKTYIDDSPLQSLTTYDSLDRVFGILRNRPISPRYKKPIEHKTAKNLIGELSQALDWIHRSPKWKWRQPPDYHEINRRPIRLESDDVDEHVPTYKLAQLKILFEYATPLERLLVLLGVNCAYGADQIGRLRIGEIIERKGVHYIKRVRKKKRVTGIHRLFDITYQGIQWAIQGRENEKRSFVLTNKKGNPLWRKTKGGNRSRDIPNAWYRLLDRVGKDHPDFPRHGFNILRDTSANMIRRIGGEEAASIHLTHRHQSRDKNLRVYTNAPRKIVFKAQRTLERKLAKVFILDDDPWKEREHQYVKQSQVKKIRAMAKDGKPVTQIAKEVGVARSTAYRWAGSKRTSKALSKRKRPTKK